MRAFPLRFQLGHEGLGLGLARVVEGLDGPAADVADGPDDSHSRPGRRLGAQVPAARGSLSVLFATAGSFGDAPRLGGFGLGSQALGDSVCVLP